jgi:D-serine deaminase-like pyridoxal phosphate-dependent protein
MSVLQGEMFSRVTVCTRCPVPSDGSTRRWDQTRRAGCSATNKHLLTMTRRLHSSISTPCLPAGLTLDSLECTGEVQTPLRGEAARRLGVGDWVYFRHTEAGESCEPFDRLHLVGGSQIVDNFLTYRSAGRTFL